MLNHSKTEILTFGYSQPISFNFNNTVITSTETARNLGVLLDHKLTFDEHISNICKTCFIQLKDIARSRCFMTFDTAKTMVMFSTNQTEFL